MGPFRFMGFAISLPTGHVVGTFGQGSTQRIQTSFFRFMFRISPPGDLTRQSCCRSRRGGVSTWRLTFVTYGSTVRSSTSSDLPPNLSFERTRSAVMVRFAARRWWRAAQLMSR